MNRIFFLVCFILPSHLFAGSSTSYDVSFNLIWILPFVGILLSIAIFPLVNNHFWHNNFGKISAFWALLFSLPFLLKEGLLVSSHWFVHAIFIEYIPFIVLLLALFTISGGIMIRGNFVGSPKLNLIFLITGTVLASWMGTTGAAMLLIRPVIRANKWRKNRTHVIIFFIFLVANIGGSLTPLGDPPLFIGFLKGVDFFWTTKYMFLPMVFVSLLLLLIFYFIDSFYYKKEISLRPTTEKIDFSINGKFNLLLLVGVVISVIFSGNFKNNLGSIDFLGNELMFSFLYRDIFLLFLTIVSYKITAFSLRQENGFSWFPITEVAKLFAGIFITVIPAISILKLDYSGSFSNLSSTMYFWLTGVLSAFLDNAPTYLVFFTSTNLAAPELMHDVITLLAISSGAVFMGALTYIGNAPNFMVRSIAEENGIPMPSFFGYMAWSVAILVPILLIYSYLWFYLDIFNFIK